MSKNFRSDEVYITGVADGVSLGQVSTGDIAVSVDTSALATQAKQDTANAALADIKTAVEALDNAISGAEMQVDVVTLPGTVEADLAAIKVAVEALDNAIAGTEMQVDVITLPGSVVADIAAIKTAIEVLDNAISGSEMQVDVVGALPAGTNNIGDVDVATIAAGETHIGQVGASDAVVDITFSLDTSGAYSDLDVLADTQELAGAARVNAGVVILESITVIDEDDQKQALTLVFLDAANSLGTENVAPNISDANARTVLGFVRIAATDYIDLGGVSIACLRGVGLQMKAAAGTTSLYLALISRGTGTYTAAGLRAKLGFLRA